MIYELEVNITIRSEKDYGQGLSVRETGKIKLENFLEVCKILGAFHDLAQQMKQQ